jgi:hypothetical protein
MRAEWTESRAYPWHANQRESTTVAAALRRCCGGINSTVRAKVVRVAKGIGPKQASHRVLSGSPWMHSADSFLRVMGYAGLKGEPEN